MGARPTVRIVEEWPRRVRTLDRPVGGGELPWRPAPWRGDDRPDRPVELYLLEPVAEELAKRAAASADEGREDLALLAGDWALDGEGVAYSVAMDVPTGPLEASSSSVRFSEEGLSEVARTLSRLAYPYVLVGWYHTHLGLGPFMSDRDLRTQRACFPHDHQHALVLDPLEGTAAAFGNGPDGHGASRSVVASVARWDVTAP